ncbi:hypothetical protein RhiXN_05447 [Rhizoctonia solani]|uniref:Uncharacterized protein n=1 Tax=Rhizoctonia solani TaxID=456999 RepID=A0A8H8NRT5_9AGAM|nr:uncharacterized protein RhiXN_05447 [Rhizoctonia solani]QRW17445.1 hypothetical protein RhiXN_05447 [Rhizoctonia solani]
MSLRQAPSQPAADESDMHIRRMVEEAIEMDYGKGRYSCVGEERRLEMPRLAHAFRSRLDRLHFRSSFLMTLLKNLDAGRCAGLPAPHTRSPNH